MLHQLILANLVVFFAVALNYQPYSGITKRIPAEPEATYRIMFYNVENFFDTWDDPHTEDNEFTPGGAMHWTQNRYDVKLRNISRVIIAAGGWRPVDIIGICEIENRKVLQDLISNTSLVKYPYRIIHKDSPDRRGIDVALIYNSVTVTCLGSRYFSLGKDGLITRDILYAIVKLGRDTCNLFVNHWPSRSAGQLETERDRFAAARLLKHLTDSVYNSKPKANIVIMGDFNDEAEDESLSDVLRVHPPDDHPAPDSLYNISVRPHTGIVQGTLKYQGQWNTFDQIIVSGNMLGKPGRLQVSPDNYRIFQNSFLLVADEMYNGFKPFRTYNGFRYEGGFSDHLPVYADVVSLEQ